MVELYKGKEIKKEHIDKLKEIARKRYSSVIYNDYFEKIYHPYQLANLHDVNEEDEILILGTGWFLCYAESYFVVEFLEWVAIDDNVDKMQQFAEMMLSFKQIFLNNQNKLFKADMRHDTSYAIYLKMLRRGLFNEFSHAYVLDDILLPKEAYNLKLTLMNKFSSIEDFLNSSESIQFSEYFQYVLHRIRFYPTQKIVNKYGRMKSLKKK